jgi:hypothetical protein
VALLIAGVDGVSRWWTEHADAGQDEVVDSVLRLLWQGLPTYADPRER